VLLVSDDKYGTAIEVSNHSLLRTTPLLAECLKETPFRGRNGGVVPQRLEITRREGLHHLSGGLCESITTLRITSKSTYWQMWFAVRDVSLKTGSNRRPLTYLTSMVPQYAVFCSIAKLMTKQDVFPYPCGGKMRPLNASWLRWMIRMSDQMRLRLFALKREQNSLRS